MLKRMGEIDYSIVPLVKSHRKKDFDCGVPALNAYFHERSGQDVRKFYATVFVAAERGTEKVLGYYTLSNASVSLKEVPPNVQKALPKYPDVPAIRLGRLAVDLSMRGRGLGAALVANAMIRCVGNVIAWNFLIVDAKDEAAVLFYRKFGFEGLLEDDRRLFIQRKELANFIGRIDQSK